MNVKTICTYIAASALAVLVGTVSVSAADQDDPAVMNQIVHGRMLPIAMSAPLDTGTLLFSDSPEYVTEDGILYGDRIDGDSRVYFYHVNESNIPKKVVVVAYNPSNEPGDIILRGYQYTKPSTSYYIVGKELSTMYYEGDMAVNRVRVEPHSYALVGERLNGVAIQPDELFSGIVDMKLPFPMYISTAMMHMDYDPLTFVQQQYYLPSDNAKLRGTFRGKDRSLKTLIPYSPKDGVGYIKIGDGIDDRFLQGRDVMDNRTSENTGNYGVDYSISIRTKGEGKIHMYFNPQGGEYAGVAEVIYTDNKGKEDKKIIALPREKLSMGLNDPYAIQYVDSFQAGQNVTVHIMPPGAANLPVRILLVPDKNLEQASDAADTLKHLQNQAKAEVEAQQQAKEDKAKIAAQEVRNNKKNS